MTVTATLLHVSGLTFQHGRRAVLHGIDLHVAPGEVVGLIGPNGAGKSTLMKCLTGIQRASGGRIELQGRALHDYPRRELARRVAYVPQHSGSAMALRVIDMVALGRLPHRGLADAATDREQVLRAIEQLQLQPLALRSYAALSGGERQRVLIARAIAQQARLLLLDEPTSDLDLRHQLGALNSVRALAAAQGVGALVAIHDLALAGRHCDRLLLLNDGRVHAQGTWEEVLTPAHLQAVFGVRARVGNDQGAPFITALSASDGN